MRILALRAAIVLRADQAYAEASPRSAPEPVDLTDLAGRLRAYYRTHAMARRLKSRAGHAADANGVPDGRHGLGAGEQFHQHHTSHKAANMRQKATPQPSPPKAVSPLTNWMRDQ